MREPTTKSKLFKPPLSNTGTTGPTSLLVALLEAMRLYNQKAEKEGRKDDHAFAKEEILAGIAGASVDGLVKSKGLDFVDREMAKRHAKKQAEELYRQQTGYTGGF
ncbi:unnamed protein product [Umbelopsis vinacea]